MWCYWFGDAGNAASQLARQLHRGPRDRMSGTITWEQPFHGPHGSPVATQSVQQPGRQHHVAVFLSFTLLHVDDHPLTVDRSRLQVDRFRDTKTGCIASSQDGALFDALYAV